MTKQTFQITKPGNIKDKQVLSELPADVVEQLGEQLQTGYDLVMSQREIIFTNGVLSYGPYKTICTVEIGTLEELGFDEVDLTDNVTTKDKNS